MKFAKRIFVGIMAVAMLVSCFAFFASAEATERPVENFNSVLEYLTEAKYLVESYEDQTTEDYVFTPSHFTPGENPVPYFSFVNGDAVAKVVGTDGKYLSVSNTSSVKPVGYKMHFENAGYGQFVTSFDFKTGDADGANGSDFFVKATLGDYFDDITLFAANTSNDAAKEFLYSDYDYDRAVYTTVKADAAPELGVWYHVEIVFNPGIVSDTADGTESVYRVKVTKGDEILLDFKEAIDKSAKGIDSVRIYVSDAADAGDTVTCFDNLAAYKGTAARDEINRDKTLAELVVKIDKYAKDELTPLDAKVEVADFYTKFYGDSEHNYKAPADAENKEELENIINGAKSYANGIYLIALETYTNDAAALTGYYERESYLNDEVERFYDFFKGEDASSFAGVEADKINAALKLYEAVQNDIRETKYYSEAFVKTIEKNYDSRNKDFAYMQLKYASLSALVDQIALDYKYITVDEETIYPTVADAKVVYDALEAKISAIANNASGIFIPAVAAMDKTQVEAVSKEAPYLTVDFEALYENYLTASSVYKNGTVHEQLDPATYPGLASVIEEYLEFEAYIQERIADCTDFIDSIRAAESSNYYKTIRDCLANAALYLDTDNEKALEKFAGVDEAIALYEPLVLALKNSEKAADEYIAAVNAINIDASYAELRVAVANARTLKESGSLIGYAGVAEADTKFAKADAKLSVLEGHSSTLLYAVAALKTATTLAERRELIFIGLGAKDGSEENISGVAAAKAELATYIQKYNEDVARVNALFAGVVGNSSSSISSVAPTGGVVISAEVIEALLK